MDFPPGNGARVVVTGGTGFLGRGVVQLLHEHGFSVRVLARRAGSDRVDVVCADVRDPDAVARALAGATAVVHAAGLAHVFRDADCAPFHEINVTGTEVVARAAAAANVTTLVVVSSVAVYGAQADRDEETSPKPVDDYGISKAEAERVAGEALASAATRLVVLRLGTLYGEGDRGNVQRLLRAIDAGRFVSIGAARNRKSLLHVADAARACILPLLKPTGPAGAYNVAGDPVVMRDVIGGLAAALGRPAPRWRVPIGAARAAAECVAIVRPRLGLAIQQTLGKWIADDVYPCERFERAYGFRPAISWPDGASRQVKWWRNTHGVVTE